MLPFRDINPTRNFPLVTVSLIVLNTLVFLYMLAVQAESGPQALDKLVNHAALIPARFLEHRSLDAILASGSWITLFTSLFLHGGPVHLFGNMLYLWIFGNNIEDIMGPVRFLIFYLLCGIIASVAYIALNADSTVPVLGASGAIAGVLGAYLVRFPYARVDSCLFLLFFVTVVRLPAIVVLAFWFLLQLFNGTASLVSHTNDGGGVAWWAHIGGFLAGMLLVLVFAKRHQRWMYPAR
jgi:membrane associated rhomboid family serine protease